jgi:two-component system sensor histidine kinase DesK
MKRLPNNLIGIIGLAVCSFNLLIDELTILQGGFHIESISLLAPLSKYLAICFTPAGSDWHIVLPHLYAANWFLHYAVFGLAFWKCNRTSARHSPRKTATLIAVQAAAALLGDGELFLAVMPQLAYYMPLRIALRWMAVLMVLGWLTTFPYLLGMNGRPPAESTLKWQFLASNVRYNSIYFALGYVARAATRNRMRLAAANAELFATQQLLNDAARASERLRIARELHDSIGHHLTALNLHLDLGIRQSGVDVPPSARTARELAQETLANMRVAVSNERRERAIDLRQALQTLCSGISQPRIALAIDAGFETQTPALAEALFCCVREAIANAVRHADARTVEVSLTCSENEIALCIADDGIGLESRADGGGLRAMHMRVAEHGGAMQIVKGRRGGGCTIDIRIPAAESQAT